jgi:hypothetical protein
MKAGCTHLKLAAGDEVISKISYTVKGTVKSVTTGQRGLVLNADAAHARVDFPHWSSAKVRVNDIGRVGDAALGGWFVGDEVVSGGVLDDGEYGSLKQGDAGIVLGTWNQNETVYVHVKFQGMRRKQIVSPHQIHRKMLSKPKELIGALAIVIVFLYALWWYKPSIISLLPTLAGGYAVHDKVVSLISEEALGLKVGDVGIVAGKSAMDPNERLRVLFGSKSIQIHLKQIAKKGVPVLGEFCVGDNVVSNLPQGSTTLSRGGVLEHGQLGRVLNRSKTADERLSVVFQGSGCVDVCLTEIKLKEQFVSVMLRGIKAGKFIKKEQRRLQKEVVQAWRSGRNVPADSASDDEEVADPFLCNICEDLLFEPVTLTCGHTMCRVCVESWKALCVGPFKSPCCSQVVPYKLDARNNMLKDIEEIYPRNLVRRSGEHKNSSEKDSNDFVSSSVASTD